MVLFQRVGESSLNRVHLFGTDFPIIGRLGKGRERVFKLQDRAGFGTGRS